VNPGATTLPGPVPDGRPTMPGRAHRSGRALLAVASLLGALALAPALAEPHAVLVRSVPQGRAVLSHPPDRVQLWFSERIEPAFSTMTVWNAAGAQVDRRDVRVGPEDPKRLTVTLPALAPGTYTVRARVLSVDGHVVETSFPFTVKPSP